MKRLREEQYGSYNEEFVTKHLKISSWSLLSQAFLVDNYTANICYVKPLGYVRIPRDEM